MGAARSWEKAAWAQCGVFEGGFTLEAAEDVLDLRAWPDAPWVVDVLQSLLDKSLLRAWVPRAEPGEASTHGCDSGCTRACASTRV